MEHPGQQPPSDALLTAQLEAELIVQVQSPASPLISNTTSLYHKVIFILPVLVALFVSLRYRMTMSISGLCFRVLHYLLKFVKIFTSNA